MSEKQLTRQKSNVAQYYRRSLPSVCTEFGSTEGQKLFTDALLEGNMKIYFKLAPQFQTQEEPAYCGISTLVMTLNALEVDPGQVWKGPWRWYHESMLECCKPLEQVKQTGINFEQFVCLARCNRLTVNKVYADSEDVMAVEKFRSAVKKSVMSCDTVLVVSYNRAVLQQTGTGHFSPIGGYHAASDKVLILDVARFKYPPHWVDLELMYKSMVTCDPETNRPRGYTMLSMVTDMKPLLFLQVVTTSSQLNQLYTCTNQWITSTNDKNEVDDFALASSLLNSWAEHHSERTISIRDELKMTPEACCRSCVCLADVERMNENENKILDELKRLSDFFRLETEMKLEPTDCVLMISLFLAFPFKVFSGLLAEKLNHYSLSKLKDMSDIGRQEISTLKTQLFVIMNEISCNTSVNCVLCNT